LAVPLPRLQNRHSGPAQSMPHIIDAAEHSVPRLRRAHSHESVDSATSLQSTQSAKSTHSSHRSTISMHSLRSSHSLQSLHSMHSVPRSYPLNNTPYLRSIRSQPLLPGLSLHGAPNEGYSTPNSSFSEDPIVALERMLRDRDESGGGKLDFQEFADALTEADDDVGAADLENIFKSICDDEMEISIERFVRYIRSSYIQTQRKSFIVTGKTHSATTRIAFRSAFPDVFGDDLGDDRHRELWADAQISSIHKLTEKFQEEAENPGVVDFAEFEAAVKNIGLDFKKHELDRLFGLFLAEQRRSRKREKGLKAGRNSKHELSLKFLAQFLEPKVEGKAEYSRLKPRQIIKAVFIGMLIDHNGQSNDGHMVRQRQREEQ